MAAKKLPEYLVLAADGAYINITLSRALDVDGAKISALRMREPTVADQETSLEIDGTDAKREILMFANLCEVSPEDIRKLGLRDYRRIQEAFLNFTN